MSIDLMMQHLQADLRVCLENPSAEAFSSLVNTIGTLTQDRPATEDDSSLWWMSHMKTSVRLFAQHPTREGYLSLIRMIQHYQEMVTKGIIQPQLITRSTTFEPNVDYWFQMLG